MVSKYIEMNGIVVIFDSKFKDICDIHDSFEQVRMVRKDYNNGGQAGPLFLCDKMLTKLRIVGFDEMKKEYLSLG